MQAQLLLFQRVVRTLRFSLLFLVVFLKVGMTLISNSTGKALFDLWSERWEVLGTIMTSSCYRYTAVLGYRAEQAGGTLSNWIAVCQTLKGL